MKKILDSSDFFYAYFFDNQLVYKQLTLGLQITKQFSGLKPFSSGSNKNKRLKESGVSSCNKRKIAVKQAIYTKNQLSQKHYWGNFKISDHKFEFRVLKIIVFLTDIGYLVKLLNNHKQL